MTAKPFVFVLMPFDTAFDDIYKLGIKATCEELDTYCERVDEQIFEENILDRIYNQINKADIVIADLTGKNPNVFYETGYAHAIAKKTILLTQSAEDIPFDLKHYPHIIYEGKIVKLKEELKKRIDWFIRHPAKLSLPNDVGIELFIQGHRLLETGSSIELSERYGFFYGNLYASSAVRIKVDIQNSSNAVFDSEFRIGVVVGYGFSKTEKHNDKKTIKLNEDEYLHLSSNFSRFYPSAWISYEFQLVSDVKQEFWEKEFAIVVRLFTEFGVKDFPTTIVYHQIPTERNTFW